MDGRVTPPPPGGRGATGPVRAADGRDAGSGVPGPRAGGAGGDGADIAGCAAAVPDGGSVAAGAVWSALVAAAPDEALSVAALAQRAAASQSEVQRALERFEAAALVLRVPRGRRATPGWMLAGGVRAGVGIAQAHPASGGYGHAAALAACEPTTPGAGSPAVVEIVAETDLPVATEHSATVPVRKPPRLAKGELEARVLAALRDRYPQGFGPLGLSREVGGYSSGAVSNCLERLRSRGLIVQTCLAPKRYAALPPESVEAGPQKAA